MLICKKNSWSGSTGPDEEKKLLAAVLWDHLRFFSLLAERETMNSKMKSKF